VRPSIPHARMGALAILCAALVLAGCAATSTAKPSAAPTAPAPTPAAPSPTPTVEDTSDVLFTISANARATDGSTVGLLLTAHAPLASDDPKAQALRTDFLAGCPTDAYGTPLTEKTLADTGSALMALTLSSNRPGQTLLAPIQLFLGGPYTTQTVSGPGIVAPSEGCTGVFTWTKSGDAKALVNFQSNASIPDTTMWRYAHYGFVVAPESGATIESCEVNITTLGADAGLKDIHGWDPSTAATGVSCGIGYSGE
jgi:hypothetical protein